MALCGHQPTALSSACKRRFSRNLEEGSFQPLRSSEQQNSNWSNDECKDCRIAAGRLQCNSAVHHLLLAECLHKVCGILTVLVDDQYSVGRI